MGYTHYWYRKDGVEDRQAFRELGTDAKRIIAEAERRGIHLGDAFGENEPEFTELRFALNGVGDEAHETFSWPSVENRAEWDTSDDEWVFSCTKTAYKPYDAVVCAILIRAKRIYGDGLRVLSDGTWEYWAEGRALYEAVFGMEAPKPFVEEWV